MNNENEIINSIEKAIAKLNEQFSVDTPIESCVSFAIHPINDIPGIRVWQLVFSFTHPLESDIKQAVYKVLNEEAAKNGITFIKKLRQ